MADPVTPSGKARIIPCPECHGVPGKNCYECRGRGQILLRACPLCGDTGWDYNNGVNDTDGMTCHLGCGYAWTGDDPGWIAQVL